jgi:hypothetical protein
VRRLVLAFLLVLAAPAHAQPRRIFNVAGSGTLATIRDGEPATSAGLTLDSPIAALPGGGFLVGSDDRVYRVDAQGIIHVAAGSGREDTFGDGGPAIQAGFTPDALSALPGGGFLIGDGEADRVRMVGASGTITTVAGGGDDSRDGIPATQAKLNHLRALAALPGGGFLVSDYAGVVRRVGPDGVIRRFAGNGASPETERLHGQPATTAAIAAADLSPQPDGGVLIADYEDGRVDRVAPDGTITVDAPKFAGEPFSPRAVAALPDGGMVIVDDPLVEPVKLLRVTPDGTVTTFGGGRRVELTAPSGLAQRLDGGDVQRATFLDPAGVQALPDGGLLLSDGAEEDNRFGGRVRYIAPRTPGTLAANLVRDRDRLIADHHATVALTLPATVTLSLAGVSTTAELPAGISRVALPRIDASAPVRLTLAATDGAGRGAHDHARLYPRPWLDGETARLVAIETGDGFVKRCRRIAATRVDCRTGIGRCGITTVRYAHDRLSFGRGRCGSAPRPHPVRLRDLACDATLPRCPLPLYGRRPEAALLPSD